MNDFYEQGKMHDVNSIRMHVVDVGTGPCILMVHGFPDSARLWRYQIPALIDAGYRVIAPDMRGFGKTDAPDGVDAYSILNIMEDVRLLLEQLDVDKAHIVAHDWGAGASWTVASFYPHLAQSLTAVSVGHPDVFGRRTIADFEKGWYQLLFQFEGVAEELVSRNDFAFLREWAGDETDLDRYKTDLSRPGRLTAAFNWYRANMSPVRLLDGPLEWPKLEIPVMGVWSDKDLALTERQMKESYEYVAGPWRYERIDGAGHWIPLEVHEKFTELLLDFLASVEG